MATPGYDPKKAELFNKLRQQGVSEEQAWTQAGITYEEEVNYIIDGRDYDDDGKKNPNKGQMGSCSDGWGEDRDKIPFKPNYVPTAAERAADEKWNK